MHVDLGERRETGKVSFQRFLANITPKTGIRYVHFSRTGHKRKRLKRETSALRLKFLLLNRLLQFYQESLLLLLCSLGFCLKFGLKRLHSPVCRNIQGFSCALGKICTLSFVNVQKL